MEPLAVYQSAVRALVCMCESLWEIFDSVSQLPLCRMLIPWDFDSSQVHTVYSWLCLTWLPCWPRHLLRVLVSHDNAAVCLLHSIVHCVSLKASCRSDVVPWFEGQRNDVVDFHVILYCHHARCHTAMLQLNSHRFFRIHGMKLMKSSRPSGRDYSVLLICAIPL